MSDQEAPLCLSRWDLFAAGALAALLVAWVFLEARLPLRVPTHFNFAGTADGWTDRSAMPWLVFGLPVGIWLLSWLLDLAMQGGDEATRAKIVGNRPLRGLMTLGIAGLGLAMLLIPLYGLWILWVALGFLFLCLGVGIWECVLAMRRLGPLDEDEHYVWGLFYVNSQDARIWVPKRIGIGWTLNFGRPAGWLMLVLLLAPLALILALR
jgi:uncharacterized membrane protein